MNSRVNLSRRGFIKGGSALCLAFTLPLHGRLAAAQDSQQTTRLNAFLTMDSEGKVIFYSPFIEMGQGTYTALPMLVAEELDIDIAAIDIKQAPHGDDYKIMFGGTARFTGGSYSVRSSYEIMRKVGAAARNMLMQAAAQALEVPLSELTTEPGAVLHQRSSRKIAYGALVRTAAQMAVPENPELKSPDRFRYLGKPVKRTDTAAKTDGSAEFGMDIRVSGMLYAAVKKSPVYGADIRSFDAAAVMKLPGVVAVESIPQGVAVIADTFWHAKKALDQLPMTLTDENRDFSSRQLAEDLKARLDEPGINAETLGDTDSAFKQAADRLESTYEVPFLAHTTMEPMNCTAHVTAERCELWAPNQGVDRFAQMAAEITGLPLQKIVIHTPYLGGGYGRRFNSDYAAQAVILSKQLGKPVKVVWTREEDIHQDFFRPMTLARHRAALDRSGNVAAWHITLAGEGPIGRLFGTEPEQADRSVVEGARHQPYAIANKRVDWVEHKHPVPIGFWRSVGHSFNGFITESFVDEMAHAAGTEPVEFRRRLLADSPRFLHLLNTVTGMAGYRPGVIRDDSLSYAYGVAIHESFGSIVAQVAKVSVANKQPLVHKVWCVVDCGTMVNPDTIEAQMQSGISTGLSQALLEELTVVDGKAVQSNFHDYSILPPRLMPEVEVKIVESGAAIGGIGEPGTPPTAAAVANALFKLTGQRVRRLPMKHYEFSLTTG